MSNWHMLTVVGRDRRLVSRRSSFFI